MLLIIVILLFAFVFFYFSEFNTVRGKHGYQHRLYDNSDQVFYELDKKATILKDHLMQKYGCTDCKRPEIVTITNFNMFERTKQFIENYDSGNIHEISPKNLMSATSFTEGKSKLVMCLRDKETEQLHHINTITFVFLHELSHMMNDQFGHPMQFWQLFKVVLQNSVECGIYVPVDYKKNPVKYCGMQITQCPLYDL